MLTLNRLRTIAERACEPCDVASLVFFRVMFGVILLWEATRFFVNGLIDSVYLEPKFHFTYLGFGWVRPLPEEWLTLHFVLLGVAALLLTLGLLTRMASAWLCLGWTYVLLMEKAAYLNHLYLVCLVAGLLVFVPTHRSCSLDALHRPQWKSDFVPAIALWTLRTQIAIPYVFGAIAKLNGDWLHGSPLRLWIPRMTHIREVIPFFGEPWMALLFSHGGFWLDLLIVPLMLWRRTRPWAFGVIVVFHLCNALMFRIGIFPWFMICATTLFFDPDWPWRIRDVVWQISRRALAPVSRKTTGGRFIRELCPPTRQETRDRRLILGGVAAWFLIQFTVPFRHLLYPGNVDWTEEGQRFSWRMMLCDKTPAMRLFAIDKPTRQVTPIDPRPFLNEWQLNYMGYDPDLLVQFSQYFAAELRQTKGLDVEIHAQLFCSLNGRRPQLLVNPNIDLASQTRSLGPLPWIVPLKEPLPSELWDKPPNTWTEFLAPPDVARP
ncbi:MAG: vitamin K-dependent gamma-carboxylase [Planctomycetota bacterium]|nr:MAG: vitamin K-dependent gamma-carboxylase [Planctomycetota bacterium]